VPVGDVLVGDTGGDIEHDDAALAVDVVTVTETTKLLLAGGIPHVELDLAVVLWWPLASVPLKAGRSEGGTHGGETEGVNFHTQGGHVLLLEFTSQVALDEGGLGREALLAKVWSFRAVCSASLKLWLLQKAGHRRRAIRHQSSSANTNGPMTEMELGNFVPCQCHHRRQARA
jgi:hypothetical protein